MIKFFKQKNKACPAKRGRSRGFTLVETLVSISIFSLSILGLLSILASGITNTTYAKEKIVAAYLNQEGIEYIRNMRDNYVLYSANGTWNSFKAKLAPCNLGSECGINNSVISTDPAFIFGCSSSNCKLYINNGNYNTNSSGMDSGFVRKIWMVIIPSNPDEVKVFSEVDWKQGSGNFSVTFSEDLFNWIQ